MSAIQPSSSTVSTRGTRRITFPEYASCSPALQSRYWYKPTAVNGCNSHFATSTGLPSFHCLRAVSFVMTCFAAQLLTYSRPGTGKTSTCVEAILQLLRAQPKARIFACAPSNSAADVLTSRLLSGLGESVGVNTLYRFYAPSRSPSNLAARLLSCATQTQDGGFAVPTLEYVQKFRIVVATCGSSSFAHGILVPPGYFSHIFVDEAGQGTEPEVMVPIRTLADARTNIILCGDPKQLGPVVRSRVARELGLGKSYMERLMQRQVYDETTGHGTTCVYYMSNH